MSNRRQSKRDEAAAPAAWATDNFARMVHDIGTSVTKIAVALIKWGGVGYCALMAKDTAIALAGKVTIAKGDIHVDAAANASVDFANFNCLAIVAVAVVIGFVGIFYGMGQAKLRRDAIARLAPYKEKCDLSLDEGRSSSKLTSTGNTRPEDE